MENNNKIDNLPYKRNESIDFLRVLCMFGIVWLHAGTFGYYTHGGIKPNAWIIHFKYMLAVCVDVFAFISGWFGVKFKLNKFLRILGLSFFCGIVAFLISHYWFECAQMSFYVILHYCLSNWYFIGYLFLMLISPLINAGLEKYDSDNYKPILLPIIILCIWQFISSIIPENHASGIGRAYFSRYSFVTIVNIYIIGRIIRNNNFLIKIKTWQLCLIVFVLSLFTAFPPMHYYTSPICIFEAICIFEVFRRIRIPSWLGRLSVFLAPSMFSILLLHRENDFCTAIFVPLEGIVLGNINPFLAVFLSAFILFITCLIIDLIRRFTVFMFNKIDFNYNKRSEFSVK